MLFYQEEQKPSQKETSPAICFSGLTSPAKCFSGLNNTIHQLLQRGEVQRTGGASTPNISSEESGADEMSRMSSYSNSGSEGSLVGDSSNDSAVIRTVSKTKIIQLPASTIINSINIQGCVQQTESRLPSRAANDEPESPYKALLQTQSSSNDPADLCCYKSSENSSKQLKRTKNVKPKHDPNDICCFSGFPDDDEDDIIQTDGPNTEKADRSFSFDTANDILDFLEESFTENTATIKNDDTSSGTSESLQILEDEDVSKEDDTEAAKNLAFLEKYAQRKEARLVGLDTSSVENKNMQHMMALTSLSMAAANSKLNKCTQDHDNNRQPSFNDTDISQGIVKVTSSISTGTSTIVTETHTARRRQVSQTNPTTYSIISDIIAEIVETVAKGFEGATAQLSKRNDNHIPRISTDSLQTPFVHAVSAPIVTTLVTDEVRSALDCDNSYISSTNTTADDRSVASIMWLPHFPRLPVLKPAAVDGVADDVDATIHGETSCDTVVSSWQSYNPGKIGTQVSVFVYGASYRYQPCTNIKNNRT